MCSPFWHTHDTNSAPHDAPFDIHTLRMAPFLTFLSNTYDTFSAPYVSHMFDIQKSVVWYTLHMLHMTPLLTHMLHMAPFLTYCHTQMTHIAHYTEVIFWTYIWHIWCCLTYICYIWWPFRHTHGWSGEGLKSEVEILYTERLHSVSSDVSRFVWESLAIIWVPEYFGEITDSKTKGHKLSRGKRTLCCA